MAPPASPRGRPRETPRRVPAGLDEHAGDRHFATTLARGLELLRCFTPADPVLGNRELSRRLGLPPATVSRLTYTLASMGYLAQDAPHGKYRLGSAVLSLGYPLLELFDVRRRARPLMLELSRATGGSVSIGIRDRFSVVYIEVIRSDPRRGYPLAGGATRSLARTALGRAPLKAPDEWARHGVELVRNVDGYARHGCCVSVGELYPDVQAVAVPLGRIDRGEAAALNCSFQGRALDRRGLVEKVGPRLQEMARKLM